jgi:beta-glucosidase
LLGAVLDTGTPTIVVLLNGRPFELGAFVGRAAAMIEAWFPGQEGAAAIADIVSGAQTPSGKLTVSFPIAAGAEPIFYNHKPLAPGFPTQDEFGFVFPFGHGLSYTTFTYGDLVLPDSVPVDGTIELSFTIANAGTRSGTEIAQIYVRDPVASITRPVLELKAFARVPLEPGESKRVDVSLPVDQLSFTGVDGHPIVEPGAIEVKVGASSADLRLDGVLHLTGDTRRVGSDRRMSSTVTVR